VTPHFALWQTVTAGVLDLFYFILFNRACASALRIVRQEGGHAWLLGIVVVSGNSSRSVSAHQRTHAVTTSSVNTTPLTHSLTRSAVGQNHAHDPASEIPFFRAYLHAWADQFNMVIKRCYLEAWSTKPYLQYAVLVQITEEQHWTTTACERKAYLHLYHASPIVTHCTKANCTNF